jgi:hypothetical protein
VGKARNLAEKETTEEKDAKETEKALQWLVQDAINEMLQRSRAHLSAERAPVQSPAIGSRVFLL